MNKQDIINLLIKDLTNEYHHMHFYLWASSVVTGLHREELSEFFYDAAQSEMKHVHEFMHLLAAFNCKPTVIESVNFTNIPKDSGSLLNYAINMEEQVVSNYTDRIKQAESLGTCEGKYLEIFLENQLLDSKNDAVHMAEMLK